MKVAKYLKLHLQKIKQNVQMCRCFEFRLNIYMIVLRCKISLLSSLGENCKISFKNQYSSFLFSTSVGISKRTCPDNHPRSCSFMKGTAENHSLVIKTYRVSLNSSLLSKCWKVEQNDTTSNRLHETKTNVWPGVEASVLKREKMPTNIYSTIPVKHSEGWGWDFDIEQALIKTVNVLSTFYSLLNSL